MSETSSAEISIAYERFGEPDGEPMLLVAGLGMQMIMWHDEFCEALTAQGFAVARFDHRDVGHSTHLHSAGRPTIMRMMLRPSTAAYRLSDMAGDAVAVLDALGWPRAHVVGISLGAMIAQEMAIRHPDRLLSLTSIAATASPRIGRLSMRTAMKLQRMQDRPVADREDAGQLMVDLFTFIGSPGYDMDHAWLREMGRRAFDRAYDQAGRLRHEAALMASRDRRAGLSTLRIPALVVHGEADRIWHLPGGRATADAIPQARFVTYPGLGHGLLPRALWPAVIDEIRTVVRT
ncbi:alpha/beta fold hydrolase [Solwaraspora sp. WMMB335]|uniref:alpha/beta fold hydrolase n=1 Tax=Solwaraspora sp. WMMB335 TaxID=3404118 RepID=UPI003B96489D